MFEALQQQAGAEAAVKACRDRIRELDGLCGSGFKEIRSGGREFSDPMTKLVEQRDRARKQLCAQMQKYLRIVQTANTELESVQDPEFYSMLQMRYVQQFTWNQIGTELQLTADTVKKRFERKWKAYEQEKENAA